MKTVQKLLEIASYLAILSGWIGPNRLIHGESKIIHSSVQQDDTLLTIAEENNFEKSAQMGSRSSSGTNPNQPDSPKYPNFSTSSQSKKSISGSEGSHSAIMGQRSHGNEPLYYQNIIINTCEKSEIDRGTHSTPKQKPSALTSLEGLLHDEWKVEVIGPSLCTIPRSEDKKTWNLDAKTCVDNVGNMKASGNFLSQGSNLILDGKSNGWIFHAPNDGRKTFYLAPRTADKSNWEWGRQTRFEPDGTVFFSNDLNTQGNFILRGASNGWILHAPNDGRTTFYIAPLAANKAEWAWGQQTRFETSGNVFFSGYPVFQAQANCNNQRDTVGPRGATMAAEDDHLYFIYKDSSGRPRGAKILGNLMGENCANIKIL